MAATEVTPRPRQRSFLEKAAGMTRAEANAVIGRMSTAATYGWLPLVDMKIDPRAQRALRRAWVKKHVPIFDANQIGTIVISRRADGSLFIIDGQHRVELLRSVGWTDQQVYCEIFDKLTIQEEAALFLRRNDKVTVRTFDKFNVSLTEGDAESVAINKIVTAAGLTVAEGAHNGAIQAVNALAAIHSGAGVASERDGAAALRRTLDAIVGAWGRAGSNFRAEIIEGIGLVMIRYGAKVKQDVLVARLGRIQNGATGLLMLAKQYRDLRGGRVPYLVGAVVVDRYNRGLRTGKLESWWD